MRKSELMTLWNVESWAVEPYGAIFVSDVDQSPRKIEYHLACTRLLQAHKPSMDDFLNSQISCRTLGSAC